MQMSQVAVVVYAVDTASSIFPNIYMV